MLRTPDEAYRLSEQHSKEYTEKYVVQYTKEYVEGYVPEYVEEYVAEQMEGVPVDPHYVHTDNNYTTAEKQKLAGINNVANLTYVTVSS